MWQGVATQVRTHRTHGTQKTRRVRQDATPTDQTQGPFLLMRRNANRESGRKVGSTLRPDFALLGAIRPDAIRTRTPTSCAF